MKTTEHIMQYKWKFIPAADKEKIKQLSQEININPVLANLLIYRGIDTYDKAKDFFTFSLERLHDPFLMKDMDKAVERLLQAIENNEKILVYGDYDVDGTTAVSTVFSYLKQFHHNLDYYIPDRYTEGYGISYKGIDYAKENGYNLVIALDCGIKAVEKIEYANKQNIDFIICDHHTPGDTLPDAVAVLDPKRKDCDYPYKELTGCGVGFKLMQAFTNKTGKDQNKLFELLDLVALSIASDIVPITGENRILAHYGLEKINTSPSTGLRALIEVSGLKDKELKISDCVFYLGPKINAAGRLEHGKGAVELLIEEDYKKALQLSTDIQNLNDERKNLQDTIVKEVLEQIENSPELKNRNSTVVYSPDWHKGVIGIVASKVIEEYYKPTIVLTKSEGKITGSARSVADFDLYSAIDRCKHLLTNFGGHKHAAGLTLEEDKLEDFINCFEATVSEKITEEQKKPVLFIAGELSFSSITPSLVKILRRFEPYGPKNMHPVFVTREVRDTGYSRLIGKNGEHLSLQLTDKSGKVLKATAFNMSKYWDDIKTGKKFHIAYTIEENEFNGKRRIELRIKDIAVI